MRKEGKVCVRGPGLRMSQPSYSEQEGAEPEERRKKLGRKEERPGR